MPKEMVISGDHLPGQRAGAPISGQVCQPGIGQAAPRSAELPMYRADFIFIELSQPLPAAVEKNHGSLHTLSDMVVDLVLNNPLHDPLAQDGGWCLHVAPTRARIP